MSDAQSFEAGELANSEVALLKSFEDVRGWIDGMFYGDERAESVRAFLSACADMIRVPARLEYFDDRPALLSRLKEVAEAKLHDIGQNDPS